MSVGGARGGPAPPHPLRRGALRVILVCVVVALIVPLLTASGPPWSPFVHRCGPRLCLGASVFTIHGATAYGTYDRPQTEVDLAVRARLNALVIVEFESKFHSLASTMSEATWSRVDQMVAAAKTTGLHVVLT